MFLKRCLVLSLISSSFLVPHKVSPQNLSFYKCQVDIDCLNYLHNTFLDTKSTKGIYQYCETILENNKSCCAEPSHCQEPWGRHSAQQIRSEILETAQNKGSLISCQINRLSGMMSVLEDIQKETCSLAVKNCEIDCQSKLDEFKRSFKICFSIPERMSLDQVLEKAKNSTEQRACYNEMRELERRYKAQSLKKDSLLREGLKPKDIVNCKQIKEAETHPNLNKWTLNMCRKVHNERQRLEKEERERKAREEAERAKAEAGRLKKEEEARKAKEEAIRIEEIAREIREDKIRKRNLAQAEKEEPNQENDKENTEETANQEETNNEEEEKGLKPKQDKVKPESSSKNSPESPNLKSSYSSRQNEKSPHTMAHPNSEDSPNSKTEKSSQKQSLKSGNTNKASFSKVNQSNSNQANSSSEIELAQANTIEEKCPVSMPAIKSAIVFQSVEAPQIETLEKQEYQEDPNNPSFESYDLVHRKPAGVLVELRDFTPKNRNLKFHLSLKIESKPEITKCFSNPLNNQDMNEGQETDCSFNGHDNNRYKFIPFPEAAGKPGQKSDALVKLYHKSHKSCKKVKSFDLNIIKIHSLHLGFIGISNKNCKSKYSFSASDKFDLIEDFMKSREVSEHIEAMFPIDSLGTDLIKSDSGRQTTLVGICNNSPVPHIKKSSIGVFKGYKTLGAYKKRRGSS